MNTRSQCVEKQNSRTTISDTVVRKMFSLYEIKYLGVFKVANYECNWNIIGIGSDYRHIIM